MRLRADDQIMTINETTKFSADNGAPYAATTVRVGLSHDGDAVAVAHELAFELEGVLGILGSVVHPTIGRWRNTPEAGAVIELTAPVTEADALDLIRPVLQAAREFTGLTFFVTATAAALAMEVF